MEAPVTVERVRPLFYEEYNPDQHSGKIRKETHPIDWFLVNSKLPVPANKFELKDLQNRLRQTIYAIERLEFEENGRLLVRIKYKRGEPVQYGFDNSRAALLNNLTRRKIPLEDRIQNYQQIAATSASRLSEEQNEQVRLTIEGREFLDISNTKSIQ